jgi:hypothetical protein
MRTSSNLMYPNNSLTLDISLTWSLPVFTRAPSFEAPWPLSSGTPGFPSFEGPEPRPELRGQGARAVRATRAAADICVVQKRIYLSVHACMQRRLPYVDQYCHYFSLSVNWSAESKSKIIMRGPHTERVPCIGYIHSLQYNARPYYRRLESLLGPLTPVNYSF